MNKYEERELKSSRMIQQPPEISEDLASLCLYFLNSSKSGKLSSVVLRALEDKLMSEYYRTVSDPFRLIPEVHGDINSFLPSNQMGDMIDAHLSLRLYNWTFEDFLHLPEYFPYLQVLRSGLDMIPALTTDVENNYLRGYSSFSSSQCNHFTPYRYSTMSIGSDPRKFLTLESEFSEDLAPSNLESFESYLYSFTELNGTTTEDARTDFMSLIFSKLNLDEDAKEFEFIPTSHTVSFGGRKFFSRHPIKTGKRYYSFSDPIGRPLVIHDLKEFVDSWNSFCSEEDKIGSAGSMRSKISRDGHYKNLFSQNIIHPLNKNILVNKSIEPRKFPVRSLVDRESCLRFQEYSTHEPKFFDVSTPYLQKLVSNKFGFNSFEKFMNSNMENYQLTSVSEYFDIELSPWLPHEFHEYGSDEAVPHYFKVNNNYQEFVL